MNTTKTTNIPKKFQQTDDSTSQLGALGWSSYFANQLENNSKPLIPARIVGVRKNIYLARAGGEELLTSLAGKLFHSSDSSLPVVGDWVLTKDSVIVSVLTRKNHLARRASGKRASKSGEALASDQVIAANLDITFIVCGMDRDFNLRRIERYIALVYSCGIEPVIVLTKADLHENPDNLVHEVESIAFGVPVYPVSANDAGAVMQLATLLAPGKTGALIGSSGAGKSTLINRLAGEEIRATSEVGNRVGKGKHTTTTRDLIVLPTGGMVIDNPGIREVGLTGEKDGRIGSFPDIEMAARSCRFKDCSHVHEPGCHVLKAIEEGEIEADRLKSYQKLINEASYHNQIQKKSSSRVEKEKWKEIRKKAKAIKKGRE